MSWRMACLAVVCLAACSKTQTSQCDDLVCPTGKVCAEQARTCVFPEQLAECSGLEDGVACTFPGAVNGRCLEDICRDTVCGNRGIDFGEACDDGNNVGGDGCSADCLSNETCGNGVIDTPREQCDDANTIDGDGCQATCLLPRCGDGIADASERCDDGNNVDGDGCNAVCTSDEVCGNGWIDLVLDEQCDDNNFVSHDGCTGVCTAELPLWNQPAFANAPLVRGAEMAYLAARDRLVLFGGAGPVNEPQEQTFELIHDQWVPIRGPSPVGRSGHAMVYDARRRRIVVFGGATPIVSLNQPEFGPPLGDTWEFDGDAWTEVSPATSPSPRGATSAVFDAARGEIVLFGGGDDEVGALGDTWGYDGTWTQKLVAGPPARRQHQMAYDLERQVVVVFGGRDADDNPLTDTWEWNGSTWTEITTAVTIPTSPDQAVYHAKLQRVMLIGGDATTWLFDGVDWSQVPGPGPERRNRVALAYDARRGLVHAHGGAPPPPVSASGEDWTFDGTTWSRLTYLTAPPTRSFGRLSYDTLRRRMLLTGGRRAGPPGPAFDDLWTWDGRRFVELDPINPPPPGQIPNGLVFDTRRGCTIMVRPTQSATETFELCGRVWHQIPTTNAPPALQFATVVYDAQRQRVVQFGGRTGPAPSNATWEFDGTDWLDVTTAMSPSPRSQPMMAYDESKQRIVLFGGQGANGTELDDTWVYDGTWRPVPTTQAPSPRHGSGMFYYAPRERVFVHRGTPGPIVDTWELLDGTWKEVIEPVEPGPAADFAFAYDPDRHRVLETGGVPNDETWEFAYSSTGRDEVCTSTDDVDGDGLAGCADPDCEGRACGPAAMTCVSGGCACAGGPTETHCDDEFDDDCDGLIDCDDPDCAASTTCAAETDCTNGIDDDDDGFTDCADRGCIGIATCEAFEASCGDGADNDGDGRVDCQDLDCFQVGCTEVTP